MNTFYYLQYFITGFEDKTVVLSKKSVNYVVQNYFEM